LLTDDMLARFDERAPVYDRENRFFHEDFDELRAAGYLTIAVPTEFGGAGLNLDEVMAYQRRLAYVAPATAVATNMHLYWTGMAADLSRVGDTSMQWILEAAARGDVFAAGHGEAGNDLGLFASSTTATRADGGYVFHGHKIFGSLSPVWDWLGIHAMDATDPTGAKVVHAFVPRDAENYRIVETWDTVGMRATTSHDTILEGVYVADEHIPLVCAAGFAGAGLFHVALIAWGLLGFANVYTAIAERALDLTVQRAHKKSSVGLTRSMAYHPEVQHDVAEMRVSLEAVNGLLRSVQEDWANGVDHGPSWPIKILSAKYFAVTEAWKVIDRAMDLSGGSGIFTRDRMQMLFRDGRLGRIHPGNRATTHEVVGKLTLGIDPDDGLRWG
jgi:alkylation response protein AidB-like acyl-CoA dehydrogenase